MIGKRSANAAPESGCRNTPAALFRKHTEKTTDPRAAIAVTIRAPSGQTLRFIGTHFQHNVPADRVSEAQAINGLFATDNERSQRFHCTLPKRIRLHLIQWQHFLKAADSGRIGFPFPRLVH